MRKGVKNAAVAPTVAGAVTSLLAVAEHSNWERIWKLMNAFASGATQNQFARVEPLAVLSEVYFMLAQIDEARRAALAQAKGN